MIAAAGDLKDTIKRRRFIDAVKSGNYLVAAHPDLWDNNSELRELLEEHCEITSCEYLQSRESIYAVLKFPEFEIELSPPSWCE